MKFRKITALLLVLCMLLSLSISVFAAEADEHTIYDSAPDEETAISTESATSGTIQNSGIRWSLDEKGRLSAIRSPRSGLRMWKRCPSRIWRTGSRAV